MQSYSVGLFLLVYPFLIVVYRYYFTDVINTGFGIPKLAEIIT